MAEPVLPGLDQLDLRALLDEVVERVAGVAEMADRLQGLLQAVVAIGSQLELDELLERIVSTAADVADAEYAALGVLDPTGRSRLSRFVTVGMDEATVARLGHRPEGLGVLGVLIDDPRPIRLAHIADHPASYGFPDHHPAMASFLGVPVLAGSEVFGNLYLTEKRGGGEFTAADEQLVLVLATAAGLAVQNARLYEQAQQRQRWLEASSEVTTQLLAGTPTRAVFELLVARVRQLAGADTVLLALPDGDGSLRVQVADGAKAADLHGIVLPQHSMSARVMADGTPVAVTDARAEVGVWQTIIEIAEVGPALFVPLGAGDAAVGTLLVANHVGGATFPVEIIGPIGTFAGQAALALRLGAAAQDREQVAVLTDRDRIARDLHDLVIQRLFATGMSLEGAVRVMSPEASADRVRRAVDDLDDTIREIRTSIFALQSPAPAAGEGLRVAILQAARAAGRVLGGEPQVQLDGPLDTLVPSAVGEQLLAVLREALSNVARHAQADTVTVRVRADADEVRLQVQDNGTGLPEGGRRSGLANLAQRAHDLGGSFEAYPLAPPQHGTAVDWCVPLPVD